MPVWAVALRGPRASVANVGAGRWAWSAALATLAAASLLAGPAAAEQGVEKTAVYSAPPECADRAAWQSSLRARLPPLLQTHPLLEALSVHVKKVQHAGNATYEGELGPMDGAPETARTLRGASCEEVLDALGFIGALGLERAARIGANTTIPGPETATLPARPDARLDAAPPAPTATPSAELGATGYALFQGGLVPGIRLALGAALELSWPTRGWQPWLQLGAYVGVPEAIAVAGGSLRFEHWSTHAVACPWRFPASGAFGVRPCLELDLGQTSGEGLGVSEATRRSAPWISTGAQLRAGVVLWSRLELGAGLAGVVPIWHSRFFLRPDQTSFETPIVGYRAETYGSILF